MIKKPTQPLSELINQFLSICKENNIKVTHQRLEIYREIAPATDHPSAEDIYRRIKPKLPTVSLDTVYRTLALFESTGIISRVHQLDDRGRFDPNLEVHHHFICTSCKKVEDFYWPSFDQLDPPQEFKKWGMVQLKMVELRGICNECLKKVRKRTGSKNTRRKPG